MSNEQTMLNLYCQKFGALEFIYENKILAIYGLRVLPSKIDIFSRFQSCFRKQKVTELHLFQEQSLVAIEKRE